jgi:hypothetical protein
MITKYRVKRRELAKYVWSKQSKKITSCLIPVNAQDRVELSTSNASSNGSILKLKRKLLEGHCIIILKNLNVKYARPNFQ